MVITQRRRRRCRLVVMNMMAVVRRRCRLTTAVIAVAREKQEQAERLCRFKWAVLEPFAFLSKTNSLQSRSALALYFYKKMEFKPLNRSFERAGWETGVPALKTFPPTINVYTHTCRLYIYYYKWITIWQDQPNFDSCALHYCGLDHQTWIHLTFAFSFFFNKKKLVEDQKCCWEQRKEPLSIPFHFWAQAIKGQLKPQGFFAAPSPQWSDGMVRDWGKTVTVPVYIYTVYIHLKHIYGI